MSEASPERNERSAARRRAAGARPRNAPPGYAADESAVAERRPFDLGDVLKKAFVWVFLLIFVSSVVGVVFLGARH